MRKLPSIVLPLLLAAAGVARGDDLTGANRILCSAGNATACDEEGACESGPAYLYNFPMFIQLDLAKKLMHTTRGSGENRVTEIQNLRRQDGSILLQGADKGKAFSFVIDEKAGMLSASVTANGFGVSLFGTCTPLRATPGAAQPPQETPKPPGNPPPAPKDATKDNSDNDNSI